MNPTLPPTGRAKIRSWLRSVGSLVTSRPVIEEVVGGLILAGILAAITAGAALVIAREAGSTDGSTTTASAGPAPTGERSSTPAPAPSDPSAGPTTASTATSGTPCRAPCPALAVVDTVVGGHDDGVWVMACFTGSCERLALAALDQRVYADCRIEDGMDVEGVTTWVRTPWDFVPGAVPPSGPVNASATGESNPASTSFGWVTARYLAPDSTIATLPLC